MAPKSKPKKKNAFMIFCNMYRHRNGQNMSLKEAIDRAGPVWSKMSEQEREKYKEKAKLQNAGHGVVNTSFGLPDSYTERPEKEIKESDHKMFKNIASTVHSMTAGRCLHLMDVCIFHVNTFCYAEKQKRHYPAELAVAKFNLTAGVWDVYHAICNPGQFPLGYAAEVAKTEATHKLPLPPESEPSNLEKIFYELLSFIDDKRNHSKPPPVYVPPSNYEVAKEFLYALCIDFGYDPLLLDVYSLTHLFYQMRNATFGAIIYHSEKLATAELERDVFEYAHGICCTVHESLGVLNQCSKSIATRMAYVICINCCRDLNIQRIPGKHMPDPTKIPINQPPSELPVTIYPKVVKSEMVTQSDSDTSDDEDNDDSSVSSEKSKVHVDTLYFDDNETKGDVATSSATTQPCSYEDDDYMFL